METDIPMNWDIKIQIQNSNKKYARSEIIFLLAPPQKLNLVSGAALQMQRELQWFKEVETFVHPKYKTEKNTFEQTPEMLFSKEHKKLVRDGEEWMKKTADSYTVTTGLITTIVFAAAITVSGGNSGDTGHPIYAKEFTVYAYHYIYIHTIMYMHNLLCMHISTTVYSYYNLFCMHIITYIFIL